MATQKLKKNLPKRCTNDHLKARRAASWKRGQERKAERVAKQLKRERINRQNGGLTPWQQLKAEQRQSHVPLPPDKKRPIVVGPSTTYTMIRRKLDGFLGTPGITLGYLDEIHRRWTILGKQLKGGAL